MPPVPLAVLRSSLRSVLDAVQTRLADWLAWPADRILKLARKSSEAPHFTGDQDILLRVGGFTADHQRHRGRHDCRVLRQLVVVLRTRNELDEADRDESWLEDATLGSIVLEENIIDALQEWFPTDAKGNALTFEGLFVLSGTAPTKIKKEQGWGETELNFGASMELPLTQNQT